MILEPGLDTPTEGDGQESVRTAGTTIEPGRGYGFFTDTTLCIGCKACEVACKQWNQLPAEATELTALSYDNTRSFSATTWRHVRFIEQMEEDSGSYSGSEAEAEETELLPPGQTRTRELQGIEDLGRLQVNMPGGGGLADAATAEGGGAAPNTTTIATTKPENLPASVEPWANLTSSEAWSNPASRWLLMSDVCKHCADAPCLEACPTGSIIRTEFDSVLVQQDICNGCGYCQGACPFGVVQVDKEGDGKAHKCTLCYDRLKDGMEPACAKACPTDSIQFGAVDELKARARTRVAELRDRRIPAYLYGDTEAEAEGQRAGLTEAQGDTSEINGLNCFFLLIDKPEIYNLPPVATRPSLNTAKGLLTGLATAVALTATTFLAFRSGSGR